MPCDTITTVGVEIGKVDKTLLDAAMKELGHTQYSYDGNRVTIRGRYLDDNALAEVKRAYSKQVIFTQAKKFGWRMKQVSEHKWEVQR